MNSLKKAACWCLLGANVVMAGALIYRHVNVVSPAVAQNARPSDYMAVPGTIGAFPNGVVYLLDTNTGQLSAMTYDAAQNQMAVMPKIDLGPIFNQAKPH